MLLFFLLNKLTKEKEITWDIFEENRKLARFLAITHAEQIERKIWAIRENRIGKKKNRWTRRSIEIGEVQATYQRSKLKDIRVGSSCATISEESSFVGCHRREKGITIVIQTQGRHLKIKRRVWFLVYAIPKAGKQNIDTNWNKKK